MSVVDRKPDHVWLAETRGADGSNQWLVGSDTEAQAHEMISRNTGETVVRMRRVRTASFIAFGELRMVSQASRFELL